MVDKIYTVTTLRLRNKKMDGPTRTPGWYPDLATAIRCVTENWIDIHEMIYDYAVIEGIPPGLYAMASEGREEHWFSWIDGGYRPCEKPESLRNVIGFGMG